MTNLPYNYNPVLTYLTNPLPPVSIASTTNTGPSGGSYESVGGYRIIFKNREQVCGASLAIVFISAVDLPSYPFATPPAPYLNGSAVLSPTALILRPGQETEYGIAPKAAEGLTVDGHGLGNIFPCAVSLDPSRPISLEYILIQTDDAPTLIY